MNRYPFTFCFIVSLLSVLQTPAVRAEFAETQVLANFSPALPQGSKPLALTPCKALEQAPKTALGGHFICDKATIQAGALDLNGRTGPFQITLTLPGNKRFNINTGPNRKDAFIYGWLESVHTVDLNADGQVDYILEFASRGVGMAATVRTMTFLFSTQRDYSWQTISRLRSPAIKQFYVSPQGRPSFITTRRAEEAVTRMPTTSDKTRHSFLVFDVLSYSVESRAMGFAQEPGFPVWVQLTNPLQALPQTPPQNIPTTLVTVPTQQLVTTNPLKYSQGGQMKSLN